MTKLSAIPRFLLVIASALALAHADHHAPKLKSIFNGKDLSGWKTPDNNIWYSASNGELKIMPQEHEKTWFKWLDNIRDWCISRQLWWGHRIPAYKIKIDGKHSPADDDMD